MASPTRILLVEDNPVDVRMVCFALEEEKSWKTEMTIANDGEQAIHYLLQNSENVDLVILDLNLPRRDGTEVLRLIRSSEKLALVPVIILSSSPEDISKSQVKAANLKANSYLRKPVGATEFLRLGERIRECFLHAEAGRHTPPAS